MSNPETKKQRGNNEPVGDKSRKRSRVEEEESSSHRASSDCPDETDEESRLAPVIENGIVEFSLDRIHSHLICGLCSGYYREPCTIIECLHTFCKSCLFFAVSSGFHQCPKCRIYIGAEISKFALLDRTLQVLIDKVLFPNLPKEDEENERAFYKSCDIQLKPEYASLEMKRETRGGPAIKPRDDEVDFTLIPDDTAAHTSAMPRLACPCLRTSGNIKVGQLKKYLLQKLPPSSIRPGGTVEIACNGVPLGNELSVTFVVRTVWHGEEDLTLTYRYEDSMT